jgi:hypothetical protein
MTARGTGGKGICTHLLATVARSGEMSSASNTKTVAPGGSSSVFRSAGAARLPRWTSVTITTWRAACKGRRWANMTNRCASSTLSMAPLR